MDRQRRTIFLTLAFIFLHLSCTQGFSSSRVTRSNNDIDNFIYGLSYSCDQVLSYKGETISSVPHTEGKLDSNKNFIVIARERKSIANGKSDIGVVSSNEHQTYPGNLLIANHRLIDNFPDVLAVDRAPLTYTVNLPGLTTDGSFAISPSFSEYQAGINKVLKTWFEKYPKDHNIVANFQNEVSFAYSKELLRTKFGLDFKNTPIETSIDFSAMQTQEKLIAIHKFKQIFYTVSVEPNKKPSDLFGPKVTVSELKQKTNNNNPPVIVDSVSYGRTIYLKIETSSTDKEARALLENKLNDIKNVNEAEINQKLKNLNLQVFVLGGASDQIELINARTIQEVNDVIVKYSKFSRTNLGFPVSYSTQFIKDNSRAVVQMATDYIETSRTVHSKGIIKIVHKGWFVMQWAVTWNEVNYDESGKRFTVQRSWDMNWHDITASFEREIELPGNTEDIHVIARECTGLAGQWWRTVIDRSGIPLINRTFSVWGTTLFPACDISPPL